MNDSDTRTVTATLRNGPDGRGTEPAVVTDTNARDAHALERHPVPIGGLLAVALLPVHASLPTAAADALAALVLALIAGIYLGFAALDGRPARLAIETAVAVGFLAFALWSLSRAPALLPLGYLAHAGWDLAHRHAGVGACVPRWYVPFCTVVDVTAAVGIAVSRAVGA